MSQNVYQFIDLQRVDPPKKPLKIVKLNLLKFTSHSQKHKPKHRPIAACPAAIRTVNGNARFITTSLTG